MRNHPRPRELTSTVIISDIAKTESRNCCIMHYFDIVLGNNALDQPADEQKKRASSEIASEGKMVGRENGTACKHLLAGAQYRVQIPQVTRTYARDLTR